MYYDKKTWKGKGIIQTRQEIYVLLLLLLLMMMFQVIQTFALEGVTEVLKVQYPNTWYGWSTWVLPLRLPWDERHFDWKDYEWLPMNLCKPETHTAVHSSGTVHEP